MDDRNMDDATVASLLDSNVDDVTGLFDQMTAADLAAVKKAEIGGKSRKGLLEAIEQREKTLAAESAADADAARDEAADDAGKTYTQEEVDKIVGDLNQGHADETAALKREHAGALSALKQGGKAPPKPKAGKAVEVAHGADPFAATRTGATQIVFADEEGVTFGDAVPPLSFTPGDFERRGEAAVLKKSVDFPGTGPRAPIAAAFLMDGGKAVGRHDFIVPITTGAGADVTIPENGMAFSAVAEPAPASPGAAME